MESNSTAVPYLKTRRTNTCKGHRLLPGRYFHVYNHAAQGLQLFRDTADYRICLGMIHDYLDSPDFSMISFCLMPNHYHFFIRQHGECPIYLIMNKVWFKYVRYYNKKYEGKGSIFAGKSQHKLVESDNYLLGLTAYIHLNPVKAGLVHSPKLPISHSFLDIICLS